MKFSTSAAALSLIAAIQVAECFTLRGTVNLFTTDGERHLVISDGSILPENGPRIPAPIFTFTAIDKRDDYYIYNASTSAGGCVWAPFVKTVDIHPTATVPFDPTAPPPVEAIYPAVEYLLCAKYTIGLTRPALFSVPVIETKDAVTLVTDKKGVALGKKVDPSSPTAQPKLYVLNVANGEDKLVLDILAIEEPEPLPW